MLKDKTQWIFRAGFEIRVGQTNHVPDCAMDGTVPLPELLLKIRVLLRKLASGIRVRILLYLVSFPRVGTKRINIFFSLRYFIFKLKFNFDNLNTGQLEIPPNSKTASNPGRVTSG